jgi:lipoprotein-anchoring transpeptidase ErfK/SrfK
MGERAASAAPEVAWQAALDRAGFSPGIIDGIVGPKTEGAFGAFQVHAGLPVTGRPDAATLAALEIDSVPAVRLYRLTAADAAEVGPAPRGWVAKSKLTRLGYKSLAELAGERGHCTRRLLAKLNPGVDLDRLSPGDAVLLPNVEAPQAITRGKSLDIDLDRKVLRVLDETGGTVGMFYCSIAADRKQRPSGSSKVTTIAANPSYLFDPVHWPEVEGVDRRLVIPPGPRNPVGLCWIGLSIPGYGIHGTPEPELIGKTGSHGCIRLLNWDVLRLAKTVRVGTEVRFTGSLARVAARR